MSGHGPFSELTKGFTAERWQRVARIRAELDEVSSLYIPPSEKARMRKKIVSSVACYRSGQSSCHLKPESRPTRRHMFAPRDQPIAVTALTDDRVSLET